MSKDELRLCLKRPTMLGHPKYRHKEEKKKILKMCVRKLRKIEDPEVILCRAVLINNTLKHLQSPKLDAVSDPWSSNDSINTSDDKLDDFLEPKAKSPGYNIEDILGEIVLPPPLTPQLEDLTNYQPTNSQKLLNCRQWTASGEGDAVVPNCLDDQFLCDEQLLFRLAPPDDRPETKADTEKQEVLDRLAADTTLDHRMIEDEVMRRHCSKTLDDIAHLCYDGGGEESENSTTLANPMLTSPVESDPVLNSPTQPNPELTHVTPKVLSNVTPTVMTQCSQDLILSDLTLLQGPHTVLCPM